MTAQVEWFCDADEERSVLDRLTGNDTIAVFDLDGQRMAEMPEFSIDKLAPVAKFCLLVSMGEGALARSGGMRIARNWMAQHTGRVSCGIV